MITGKKIGITGHCSGIGAAVWNSLQADNQLIGFSRNNDYDLTDKNKYAEALEILKDCDIVINNAYDTHYRFLQTDILNDWLDKNIYDPEKCIVTLGSMSKYVNKSQLFNRYASSKVLIDDTLNRAKLSGHKCGLILVSPNWVDTALFQTYKNANPSEVVNLVALTSEEVADQIYMLLDFFYNKNINIYIHEIKKMRY